MLTPPLVRVSAEAPKIEHRCRRPLARFDGEVVALMSEATPMWQTDAIESPEVKIRPVDVVGGAVQPLVLDGLVHPRAGRGSKDVRDEQRRRRRNVHDRDADAIDLRAEPPAHSRQADRADDRMATNRCASRAPRVGPRRRTRDGGERRASTPARARGTPAQFCPRNSPRRYQARRLARAQDRAGETPALTTLTFPGPPRLSGCKWDP